MIFLSFPVRFGEYAHELDCRERNEAHAVAESLVLNGVEFNAIAVIDMVHYP